MELIRFEKLTLCDEVVHFQTTRPGGGSGGSCSGLNLGFNTPDDPLTVLENRKKLAQLLDVPLGRFVFCNQTHGTRVGAVTAADAGRGAFDPTDAIESTDALITDCPGVMLAVQTADCIPVLCYDPIRQAVAAIHAGWKGTLGNIAAKTIAAMTERFGTRPADVIAGIGVGAGVCCYEVGDEVVEKLIPLFSNYFDYIGKNNKGNNYLDLKGINRRLLIEAGVLPENISARPECSICENERFFSARSHPEGTGRMACGILIRK